MKEYVNNILPRIKNFSESLDKKSILVDKPWVIIDEQENHQKYIFKRNGDLVMSMNGSVQMGRWEYLSSARSLLIDRIEDKVLLNQDYVDPAVMLLKKDGPLSNRFVLANEVLIPDLDVEAYLRSLYLRENHIKLIKTDDGQVIEIHRNDDWDTYYDGKLVTVDGSPIKDGILFAGKTRFQINSGRIHRTLELKAIKRIKGYFNLRLVKTIRFGQVIGYSMVINLLLTVSIE